MDLQFAGVNAEGTFEYVLTGTNGEYSSVERHAPGAPAVESEYAIPGVFTGSMQWYGQTGLDVSLLGAGIDEDGSKNVLMYYNNTDFGWEYCGPILYPMK